MNDLAVVVELGADSIWGIDGDKILSPDLHTAVRSHSIPKRELQTTSISRLFSAMNARNPFHFTTRQP